MKRMSHSCTEHAFRCDASKRRLLSPLASLMNDSASLMRAMMAVLAVAAFSVATQTTGGVGASQAAVDALAAPGGAGEAYENPVPPGLRGEPWRHITAQIEASRHEVRRVDGVWRAHTPRQDYVTEFTEAGPVFRLDDGEATHEIGLLLDSIDVDGRPVELAAPRVHAEGNRFEYQRGAVTEWYVNNAEGVRQWFRIDEAPAGDTLSVAMRLDSDLTAAMDGADLRLNDGHRTVARFAGLQAWDARQSPLPASMRVEDGRLVVAVDTSGAAWPITIDPVMFNEVAKLLPSPAGIGGENSQFGYSVSVDGNRALVGGINWPAPVQR